MAGPYDFTGQNIENTYQRVLQTPDGTTFYDGTGSLVILPSANTSSLLTTASVNLNTITFTKGNGTTFPITVNTGSGGSTFPFTGSAIISGSLIVTGSIRSTLGFTGSLFGTASWATNALTSSFVTASNVYGPYGSNSIISASFAVQAQNAATSTTSDQSETVLIYGYNAHENGVEYSFLIPKAYNIPPDDEAQSALVSNDDFTYTSYDSGTPVFSMPVSSSTFTIGAEGKNEASLIVYGEVKATKFTTLTNTIVFTDLITSGSRAALLTLSVSSSNLVVSGGGIFSNVTGSLLGTASFAQSSSIALTASFLPIGTYNVTSSWANNYNETDPVFTAKSGSFTTTSSFNSFTSSYTTGSFSGSFTGNFFGTASFTTSSSYAITASYALNGGVTQLLAGSNISLSPTNGLGQVTITSTGGGSSFNTATGSYGSFYSTITQTNVAGTARSMSLNITDITNGVSISGSTNPYNTYIKTENPGVYDIQFSAQVDKTDSGTDEIWIWLRKNGSNVSDSATSLQLVGNGAHYVAAWNFFVNAAANDYFQLMWYSPDANVRLHAEAGFGVVPGIPSLIVTANRVDQFLSNTGSFSGSFTGNLIGTASFATNSLTASFIDGGTF
jgi:hypothetical protein